MTADRDDGGDEDDQRGEEEDDLVGRGRDQVFLAEQLDAVGDRLEEAVGPVRVGPSRSCKRAMTLRSNQVM